MTYEVKTRVFEGPLDLLLQLITSHQVEITDLSLSDLVAEYLDYLDVMTAMDLTVTSEFLLIASTLIQLKARHLLPDDRDVDLDDELALAEERDRLLSRLLMNLTFKDVAAVLSHRMAANERHTARSVGLEGVTPTPPDFALPVDAAGLAAIAERVFADAGDSIDIDHLDTEMPSVQEAMLDLQDRMALAIETDFDDIVSHCSRSVEVVAYFLGLLELARWGIVRLSQEDPSAAIDIRYDREMADARFAELVAGDPS